jgi:hypothetical protein
MDATTPWINSGQRKNHLKQGYYHELSKAGLEPLFNQPSALSHIPQKELEISLIQAEAKVRAIQAVPLMKHFAEQIYGNELWQIEQKIQELRRGMIPRISQEIKQVTSIPTGADAAELLRKNDAGQALSRASAGAQLLANSSDLALRQTGPGLSAPLSGEGLSSGSLSGESLTGSNLPDLGAQLGGAAEIAESSLVAEAVGLEERIESLARDVHERLCLAEKEASLLVVREGLQSLGYSLAARSGRLRASRGTTCLWVEADMNSGLSIDVSGHSGLSCQKELEEVQAEFQRRGLVLEKVGSDQHGKPEGGVLAQKMKKMFPDEFVRPAASSGKRKATGNGAAATGATVGRRLPVR